MTTAHRPTFDPARGGTGRNEGDLSKLSQQYSSRDMPSHLKLKYRQKGQSHPEELSKRDLRGEIEYRETSSKDHNRSRGESSNSSAKKPRMEVLNTSNVDADDPLDELDDSDASESDSDDDTELMAELERIKRERAAEKAAREQREQEAQEKIRQENILHGNPLLNAGHEDVNFKVKRRWDDDVVFKNCARGIDERKKEPTFINDAIRSEFHRKFMEKYIK